jgi:hypothetical protein
MHALRVLLRHATRRPGALGAQSGQRLGGQLADKTPSKSGEIWDRTLTQSPCLERFAGKKPAHQFNGGLLAMQKPSGSTPIGATRGAREDRACLRR